MYPKRTRAARGHKCELDDAEVEAGPEKGSEAKSLTAASKHMNAIPGWKDVLTQLRLNRPGGFLQGLKTMSIRVSGATGPGQRTIRAVRRRITGKSRAAS